MKALDLKLLRDLWRMKGQALAIVLVMASGVATFVMLMGVMDALNLTRAVFYREYGFADAFVSLKRAPEALGRRIADVPGVEAVETRVVAEVKLDVEGFGEPVTARLVSVPDTGEARLNRIYIRKGRNVEPWSDDEAVVSEAFAEAHGLGPGSRVGAVINGRLKALDIVGTALSPEFILQTRPGAISPDFERYAILWMGRHALGSAYGMAGAFNDAVVSVSPEARLDRVLAGLDGLIERYGGLGSIGRADQISHRFLSEEFKQLQRSAEIFPAVFIAVAAFLLNVVMVRTVGTQREQIAALKAFGYSNAAVAAHYVKMVMVIVAAGSLGGLVTGAWLGRRLGGLYMEFYRFPYLIYELRPSVAITAVLITALAALAGTLHAVVKAAKRPPAEGMRTEAPTGFGRTIIERAGLGRRLSQSARMISRNIERAPVKSLLTVTGIAMSCAIMIAGTFAKDSVDFMVDFQFNLSRKEDMSVTFTGPVSGRSLHELEGLPGVERVEGMRVVPARIRRGHLSERTVIQGIDPVGGLRPLLDASARPIEVPREGILLTDYLGETLGARAGDTVVVEALEGRRAAVDVPVAGLTRQYLGVMAYMDTGALNRLMKEGRAVSGAYLTADEHERARLYRTLVEMPGVAGTVLRKEEIRSFYETQAEALLFFTFIASLLGATIAFGVVYNSARVALSERARELASLRVLGYTRTEIAYIFLGEFALLTLVSIPVGFVLGYALAAYIASAISSDLFRVPVVVRGATYSLAAAVVLASAVFSGVIVKIRLDRLDLVGVLKARE
jgi:putative ABC transport system permease protein